jgi:hypothetical protein
MQTNPLIYWLQQFTSYPWASMLRKTVGPVYDRMSSRVLQSGGAIVIKAGGSTLVKTGAAATYAIANGRLLTLAPATDLAALAGTVANARFNVFGYFVDSAGALTSGMGTEGASLGTLRFPQLPIGKAWMGFTIINPTGTGNFVGGTTALDDATVVPNAVHVTHTSGGDPACVIGGQLTNW